jgi:hypothetical protein
VSNGKPKKPKPGENPLLDELCKANPNLPVCPDANGG